MDTQPHQITPTRAGRYKETYQKVFAAVTQQRVVNECDRKRFENLFHFLTLLFCPYWCPSFTQPPKRTPAPSQSETLLNLTVGARDIERRGDDDEHGFMDDTRNLFHTNFREKNDKYPIMCFQYALQLMQLLRKDQIMFNRDLYTLFACYLHETMDFYFLGFSKPGSG